jgi:hypothetical protein
LIIHPVAYSLDSLQYLLSISKGIAGPAKGERGRTDPTRNFLEFPTGAARYIEKVSIVAGY